jgi:hypothetical protein
MLSDKVEIVLVIVALYGSTCVAFLYANEGLVERVYGGVRLRVAADRVRIAGRSPAWLNPFTPMFPAFRGYWGSIDAIAASPGLSSRVREMLAASEVMAPYVFAAFLYTVVGIPIALLIGGGFAALPMAVLAYLAAVIMLVRLWFLRGAFALNGFKFAALAFECLACLPFSAGVVRRLGLAVPVGEDLATFVAGMDGGWRIQAVKALDQRCTEMTGYYADESAEYARLQQYHQHLLTLVTQVADAAMSADVAREPSSPTADVTSDADDMRTP